METFNTERGIVAGGISVLMVFITVCIAIYGLLSLLAARNELSLNLKNRDAAVNYYKADARAETIIFELVSVQERGGAFISESDSITVIHSLTGDTATFAVPIDQYRNLDVSIAFSTFNDRFVINRYRVVNSLDWHNQVDSKITVLTKFD